MFVYLLQEDNHQEGILIILDSRTFLSRKTTIYWSSHHWKGNTKPLSFFFKTPASHIIRDLIQGKTIQLREVTYAEPLTFTRAP